MTLNSTRRVDGQRRRMVVMQLGCVMLLTALAACTVEKPNADEFPPSLTGRVTNSVTNAAIVGATVSGQGKSAVTGANGSYILGDFTAGTYKVKVSHSDYADAERDVSIQRFLQTADFQLQPK